MLRFHESAMMVVTARLVLFALVALVFIASSGPVAHAAGNEAVAKVVEDYFKSGRAAAVSEALGRNIATIEDFYQSRNFKPVWTRDSGPKGKGKALFEELNRSSVHGLSPEFYNVASISPLMSSTAPEELARLDLLLSGAFIDYAHDLRNGRAAANGATGTHQVKPVRFSASELISDAADAGNLRNLASEFLGTDDRYIRLIAKYVEFDRIAKSGLWPEIDASGKPIASGQQDDRMNAIRTILLVSGDLPQSVSAGGALHDSNTFRAVKSYQARMGLPQTGDVDQPTLEAMAVPIESRMEQILVNLERRRWQNRDLEEHHVYVNLADEQARVVLKGEKAGFLQLDLGESRKNLPTFFATVTGLKKTGNTYAIVLQPEMESSQEPVILPIVEGAGSDPKTMFGDFLTNDPTSDLLAFNRPFDGFVTYLTAWANKDGSIYFRNDNLQRDQEVARLLTLD